MSVGVLGDCARVPLCAYVRVSQRECDGAGFYHEDASDVSINLMRVNMDGSDPRKVPLVSGEHVWCAAPRPPARPPPPTIAHGVRS